MRSTSADPERVAGGRLLGAEPAGSTTTTLPKGELGPDGLDREGIAHNGERPLRPIVNGDLQSIAAPRESHGALEDRLLGARPLPVRESVR